MSLLCFWKGLPLHVNSLLLLGVKPVRSVSWSTEVNVTICNWSQLRANFIRDTIYLDGGDLWWQFGLSNGQYGSPFNDDGNSDYTYNISLTHAFDQQTNMTGLLQSMAKNGGTSAANMNPNYEDGVMFANDYDFILYGGLTLLTSSNNPPPPSNMVLGYEAFSKSPSLQGWQPGFLQKSTDNGVTRYITNGAGVSAPSENLGFYFSGVEGPNGGIIEGGDGSANTTATSLITANMTQMGLENWQNSTLPPNVLGRANAELVWLPVSESGVLVAIGGVINPEILTPDRNLTYSEAEASNDTSPMFMKQLSIFDVASETWYLQNTTGDTPPQLTLFCSAVAAASDRSSFNIYIYGGYNGVDASSTPSDDVYILSVPSFTWIKAYSGQPTHGRSGHKCLNVYPDQMFVIGGIFQNNPTICLEGGYIQVFNLNALQFQDNYSPGNWSNYSVPSIVTDRIGGDANGGAIQTSPSSWDNEILSSVFAKTYTKPITTYYPYTSAAGISSTPTSVPSSVTTSTAIAASTSSGKIKSWETAVVSVCMAIGSAGVGVVALLVARRLTRKRLLNIDDELNTSHNSDRIETRQPSERSKGYFRVLSTSTLALTKDRSSRPHSEGPEQAIAPIDDGNTHAQAESYTIFELDSRVDKRVELPCEERETGRKLNVLRRNILDLRIHPYRNSSSTASNSVQNTPVEFKRRPQNESVQVSSPRDTQGSILISEKEANAKLDGGNGVVSALRYQSHLSVELDASEVSHVGS